MGHRWLKVGRVSPAAGIVGALCAVADGAKGPLRAADGCSAGIPAGQVRPVREQREAKKGSLQNSNHDDVVGEDTGTRAGCSCRIGGTERGRGGVEFKAGGFCRTGLEEGWEFELGIPAG